MTNPTNPTKGHELLTRYWDDWKRRIRRDGKRGNADFRIRPAALNDSQRVHERSEKLGADRFATFKSLVAAYENKPNLENYLRLRREIPEAEIDIALFGGPDPLFTLEPQLRKHGIDPLLVAGAQDACVPDMDELSLRLMECLVAREKLPKSGPRHIEMRRNAISDALVDYLIVMMLEATEWNKEGAPNEIPSSLIVLIRERLCGAGPDLREELLSSEKQKRAAYIAAQHFEDLKQVSGRKLSPLTGISKTTLDRWVKSTKFKESFVLMKRFLAEKASQKSK